MQRKCCIVQNRKIQHCFLYVMALRPNLLSGLDRTIALAWSKAQWRVRDVSRVCFDYEIYYSGDLCAEFKSRLNDFETCFE